MSAHSHRPPPRWAALLRPWVPALIGALALAPTTWRAAVIAVGLSVFATCDWRTRTVPAGWFDAWCLAVVLLHLDTLHWGAALFWLITLGLLAALTQGLGSADWLAITVLAATQPLTVSLWWVLLACASAAVHQALAHPQTLPLLTHLALAACLLRWWG